MSDILGPGNGSVSELSGEPLVVARPSVPIPRVTQPPAILFNPMPFPSIGQAVAITLLLLVAQIICGIGFGIVAAIVGSSRNEWLDVGSLSFINLLASGITFWITLHWGGLKTREALCLYPIPLKNLLPMLVTTLGMVPLLRELGSVIVFFFPPPDFVNEMFGAMLGPDISFWKAALFLAVIAPITEEPVFRGLLLGGFLRRYKPLKSIMVTSVLFAFVHLNLYQFVTATLLGLLYGWWFFRTRSLWPSLFGHAINNALVLFVPRFPMNGGISQDVPQFQAVWFDFLAAILFIVGLVWTMQVFKNLPRPGEARPVQQPPDAESVQMP